jgi:hypothetical protein
MTIDLAHALDRLERCWNAATEALTNLRVCLVEDKPRRADSALIDLRADLVEDLLGRLADAAAGGVLARHAALHEVRRRFVLDLVSYERVRELLDVARAYGAEGKAWADGVRRAFGDCAGALFDADEAVIECWRNLHDGSQGAAPVAALRRRAGQAVMALVKDSDREGEDGHAR